MARVILSFFFLTLAAIGIVWLVERPEDVVLIWQGQRVETSLAVIVAGIFLLALALLILWSTLRFLVRLPGLIGRRDGARRREKGYAALSKGLVAVGAGDVVAAERHAREARRFIKSDPLSLLLDAQAAQLGGDRDGARRAFRDMTQAGPARLLGWRGLFVEAQRAGDEDAAREAADAAVRIAPASAWANQAVLSDRFARGDWAGARLSLEQAERLRILDRATSKRQRAVLLTAEAEAAADPAQSLALAREAVDLAPDLVPAATLAARLLAGRNDLRRAAKLLEAAWKAAPHPGLAETYVHLRSGDSALDRLQRAQALAKLAPGDADGAFAVARAAIDARELSVARAALTPLVAERPTVRVCLLMADLAELGDEDQGETRHWLARAARAPRDKAWIGDGVVSDRWLPVSPASGRLDAFVWGAPPEHLALAAGPDLEIPPVAPAPAIDAPPSSPVAPEGASPDAAGQTTPGAQILAPSGDNATPAGSRPPRPTPVIFPVAQAPDDPGPKTTAPSGRWRVFNG